MVCGLGLRSLVWVVWLAGARVLRLAGPRFSDLVVSCGAVPLRRAMGAARVVWLGYDSVGLGCTFGVVGRCAVCPDRRIRLSFSSCLVRRARVGVAALALVVVLRGLVWFMGVVELRAGGVVARRLSGCGQPWLRLGACGFACARC